MATFLFLEPHHGEYNELQYLACVGHKYAAIISKLGHKVYEVVEPTPDEANKAILKYKPQVVWWCGHGNVNVTTLEKMELWIYAPYKNTKILKGTIASALSCLTAKYLGLYEVKKAGCLAYHGYEVLAYFMWCGKNFNCSCSGKNPYGLNEKFWYKCVTCVPDSHTYFVYSLAKGNNTEKAFSDCISRFKYWIDYFENYNSTNMHELAVSHVMCWTLEHDMNGLVIHGKYGSICGKTASGYEIQKGFIALSALALLGVFAEGLHAKRNYSPSEL